MSGFQSVRQSCTCGWTPAYAIPRRPRREARHAHLRQLLSERLEVLHDHAQPAHPKAVFQRLPAALHAERRAVLRRVVEPLLGLPPVAPHREVRAQERGVDAPEVALGDVRLEDVGPHEEDVAELADELEAVVQGGDGEAADRVLVRLEISVKMQSRQREKESLDRELTLRASAHPSR